MYTAAVIGCGRIGSLYDTRRSEASSDPLTHAGAYMSHPRTRLVAGVDPDPDRRALFTARWCVAAFATIEDMLGRVSPDLWSVCAPPHAHAEIVGAAIRAGAYGIWCEKPLVASLPEAVRLVDQCAQARIPLLMNHTRRFDVFHQDLARRLQAGVWGAPERMLIHYVRGLCNYGSHAIDLARFLLQDEIAWVSAWDELGEDGDDPSLTVAGATSRSVPISLVPARRRSYDAFEVDIWGAAGRVTISDLGKSVRQWRVGPSLHWDEPAVLLETPGTFLPGMQGAALAAVDNLVMHLRRRTALISTGRDAVMALAAIAAARQSARQSSRRVDVGALLAGITAAAIEPALTRSAA